MTSPDPEEEIRFIADSIRLLRDNVEATVLSRGWAVADLEVADQEPLEWFWPPTAPVGYGGHPDWLHRGQRVRPRLYAPRRTPWTVPTRISGTGNAWLVEYGEAIAQEPDEPQQYTDGAELIDDLDRIEWWPMTVDEARRVQAQRLFQVTTAMAHDQHHLACPVTEPYGSRFDAITGHRRHQGDRARGDAAAGPPSSPRPRGSLDAQWLLIDAEAWTSAVRTARAGGTGWGMNGPVED